MRLFVGLGNPGPKYQGNRHNIGFMVVDEIARRHGFAPWRRRFQGETSEGTLDRERVILLKPDDLYERVRAARSARPRTSSSSRLGDIVVFHDELELPPAKVRVKVGGGIAGHNGLRSIDAHVGNEYRRVRHRYRSSGRQGSRASPRADRFRQEPSGRGSRRCATRSPTMPACSRPARTRRFRTRCIWRCRRRDLSTQEDGDKKD